ncbi:Rhodanese-like domain-containing protein 4A [Cardamine amara subsp. amara]|uniref:Rhodanese-like domain-containing protein 4A n=1 Tax=Cardamine amara subsp. amara TaxID=228776 RepID=A0ABD1BLD8_CARAN
MLVMTSLPTILASSPLRNLHKASSTIQIPKLNQTHLTPLTNSPKFQNFQLLTKTNLSITISQILLTSPVLASESISDPSSGKIDLESILISIDNFFNKYPFFVAGCTFMYLVVYPAVIFYLRRDEKTLASLASPNLKFLGKSSVQVPFSENDEEGFMKKVKGSFSDPDNTVVCVLDNFDGNSMKVAELLIKNGFKEAYYIKGGARGKKGWLAIQEELLPPPVHMYTAKNVKSSNNNEASIVATEN